VASFEAGELARHYAKHGGLFPGKSVDDYENAAARFLESPHGPTTLECRRRKGDLVRFDLATDEFGVLSANGQIRTYFKPVPCASLPVGFKANCHGFSDNITYFRKECLSER
jgi:pyocin large subunit-like protein